MAKTFGSERNKEVHVEIEEETVENKRNRNEKAKSREKKIETWKLAGDPCRN